MVAHRWLTQIYEPIMQMVPRTRKDIEGPEIFHEILEHRWYLSEWEGHEVDIFDTARDYIRNVLGAEPDEDRTTRSGHRHVLSGREEPVTVHALDLEVLHASIGRGHRRRHSTSAGPEHSGQPMMAPTSLVVRSACSWICCAIAAPSRAIRRTASDELRRRRASS